ncbi:MAG: pantoate--beta-alanine ligase [Candidatus Edwardsbacteria bacterium]|nr:pantoate--beta-alanine ligase [Candidatus Edwardsbacteria bacterium]
MRIVKSIPQLRKLVAAQRTKGRSIGFVPTMGALHEGHLSLIRLAQRKSKYVVVSIFVNPAQFGPKEDLAKYPRDLKRDAALCRSAGADLVFAPRARDVYPDNYHTYVTVGQLSEGLCGASRPGHFKGVATVVAKLFNMVQPDVAVFGQKDAQQAAVIRQLARDLDFPVRIVVGPIVRERDGLAMSSRNAYLTPAERAQAPALHHALNLAKWLVRSGRRESGMVKREMMRMIAREAPLGEVDYVGIVNNRTLEPITKVTSDTLVALAVKFPSARLIDNVVIR